MAPSMIFDYQNDLTPKSGRIHVQPLAENAFPSKAFLPSFHHRQNVHRPQIPVFLKKCMELKSW